MLYSSFKEIKAHFTKHLLDVQLMTSLLLVWMTWKFYRNCFAFNQCIGMKVIFCHTIDSVVQQLGYLFSYIKACFLSFVFASENTKAWHKVALLVVTCKIINTFKTKPVRKASWNHYITSVMLWTSFYSQMD